MSRRNILCMALLMLSALLVSSGLATGAGEAAARGFQVVGFQDDGDPAGAIRADARAVTQVDIGTVFLGPNGRLNGVGASERSELRLAHRLRLPALLVVSNWGDSINDFSEPLGHELLGDRRAIDRVVRALAVDVKRQGWQGVNVDLENLQFRDDVGLVRFLAALRAALGPRREITVDVFGLIYRSSYVNNGYRLPALARYANAIDVMGYDDHFSPGDVGPVGPLGWQRQVLRVVLSEVPARKVILGVAGYGYSWGPKARDNQYLSDAQARAMVAAAGVTAMFDTRAGEWMARLPGGVVLWWSDARSWALRMPLAKSLHLAGMALWDMALSDRLPG